MFVVDSTNKDRLPVVAEMLEEMARHQGLTGRDIPFLVLNNKSDLEDAIDEKELTKFIELDKLKTMNDLRYTVLSVTGITGEGVDKAMKFFEQYAR